MIDQSALNLQRDDFGGEEGKILKRIPLIYLPDGIIHKDPHGAGAFKIALEQ